MNCKRIVSILVCFVMFLSMFLLIQCASFAENNYDENIIVSYDQYIYDYSYGTGITATYPRQLTFDGNGWMRMQSQTDEELENGERGKYEIQWQYHGKVTPEYDEQFHNAIKNLSEDDSFYMYCYVKSAKLAHPDDTYTDNPYVSVESWFEYEYDFDGDGVYESSDRIRNLNSVGRGNDIAKNLRFYAGAFKEFEDLGINYKFTSFRIFVQDYTDYFSGEKNSQGDYCGLGELDAYISPCYTKTLPGYSDYSPQNISKFNPSNKINSNLFTKGENFQYSYWQWNEFEKDEHEDNKPIYGDLGYDDLKRNIDNYPIMANGKVYVPQPIGLISNEISTTGNYFVNCTDLQVVGKTETSVYLAWNCIGEVAEFYINEATGKFDTICDTDSVEITGLEPGTEYKFRVRAKNKDNVFGAYTDYITVKTDGVNPTATTTIPTFTRPPEMAIPKEDWNGKDITCYDSGVTFAGSQQDAKAQWGDINECFVYYGNYSGYENKYVHIDGSGKQMQVITMRIDGLEQLKTRADDTGKTICIDIYANEFSNGEFVDGQCDFFMYFNGGSQIGSKEIIIINGGMKHTITFSADYIPENCTGMNLTFQNYSYGDKKNISNAKFIVTAPYVEGDAALETITPSTTTTTTAFVPGPEANAGNVKIYNNGVTITSVGQYNSNLYSVYIGDHEGAQGKYVHVDGTRQQFTGKIYFSGINNLLEKATDYVYIDIYANDFTNGRYSPGYCDFKVYFSGGSSTGDKDCTVKSGQKQTLKIPVDKIGTGESLQFTIQNYSYGDGSSITNGRFILSVPYLASDISGATEVKPSTSTTTTTTTTTTKALPIQQGSSFATIDNVDLSYVDCRYVPSIDGAYEWGEANTILNKVYDKKVAQLTARSTTKQVGACVFIDGSLNSMTFPEYIQYAKKAEALLAIDIYPEYSITGASSQKVNANITWIKADGTYTDYHWDSEIDSVSILSYKKYTYLIDPNEIPADASGYVVMFDCYEYDPSARWFAQGSNIYLTAPYLTEVGNPEKTSTTTTTKSKTTTTVIKEDYPEINYNDNSTIFYLTNRLADKNSKIYLPIVIKNNVGLYNAKFTLNYNPNYLTVKKVINGDVFSNISSRIDEGDGIIEILLNDSKDTTKNGIVAYLEIDVGDVENINFIGFESSDYLKSNFFNISGECVPCSFKNGNVIVGEIGDIEIEPDPKCDEHTYISKITKEADCTNDGKEEFICTVCGDYYFEKIAALGHDTTLEHDKNEHWNECSRCDGVLDKESHDFEYVSNGDATCTENGTETGKCKVCEQTHTREVVDSALGHEYSSEWSVDKQATCSETGAISRHCVRYEECGSKTEEITTPKTKHTESDWEVVLEATENNDGIRRKFCTVCKETLETEYFEYHKHSYEFEITKEATCEESGIKTYTCTLCSNSYTEEIGAIGHSYCDWVIDKESSCTEIGNKHKECENCGKTITEDIELIDHVESNWIIDTEAGCTEQGRKHKECIKCKLELEVAEIESLGHSESNWKMFKQLTCTEDGVLIKECIRCNIVLQSEPISALGHKLIISGAKTATYFANGYTGDKKCIVCGDIVTKGESIAKLKLKTPTVKYTGGKKKITIKHTKVTGATSFEVQYKKGNGKWQKATYVLKKNGSKVIKKLKKGNYKIRVRAFVKQNGKTVYSNWTNQKTSKVK